MGKKKGKGKKKSKEEIEAERLAREEEERLAEEAEKARLAEEARVLEEERRRKAEEAAALRKEELERLDGEHEEAQSIDEAHRAAVAKWATAVEEAEEWERFRSSDGGFDISKESKLNAFLADIASREYPSIEAGTSAAELVVDLLSKLVARKAKSFEAGDAKTITKHLDFVSRFEKAVLSTLDRMLTTLVDKAKTLSKGKNEYQGEQLGDGVGVGLWMNIVPKGYRPRIVKYESLHHTITIPRNLMSHSLAMRLVVFTRAQYDLSLLAPSFEGDASVDSMSEEERALIVTRATELHEQWRATRALPDGTFRPRNSRCDGKVEDIANLAFGDISEINQQPFITEAEFVERWLAATRAASDFSAYGQTTLFELLDMPPPSRQLKKWMVREVQDPDGPDGDIIARRSYPLEGTPPGQFVPPIKFAVSVPDDVVVAGSGPEGVPQVGLWDPDTAGWTTEPVTEVAYNAEERLLKFQVVGVGHVSLVQPRSIDVPLKYWEIKQFNYKGALRLSIRTARDIYIDVKIHDDGCSLIFTPEGEQATPPELHYLAGKVMGARELFERLAYSGVNLLLTAADAARISGPASSRAAFPFETLHWDIAQTAGPARFFMSKWNASRPGSECVFNVAAAEAEHYDTVRVEVDKGAQRGVKYSVLQVRENKSKFSRKLMQDEKTHSRLEAALQSRFSTDTRAEIDNHRGETATIEILRRVLDTINLLNFS